MQIDVLVLNEKNIKITKNIGRIFRQHNIVEYKSPEDYLNIDDFYKVYGYTCIYKTEVEKVNQIPAEELTITLVGYRYPREMLKNLKNERNISVESVEHGIYYLHGDAIPIQLIVVPELSIGNNYWLNKLRNDLKSGGEIKLFMKEYEKNKDSKLFQALADTVMRANWKEAEEERKNMSDVLKEIFAKEFEEYMEEGMQKGIEEGMQKGIQKGIQKGMQKGIRKGIRKGMEEGRQKGKIELLIKKYKKGYTAEEAADALEEKTSIVQQIYDIIGQYAPDYDIEKICNAFLQKNKIQA